MTNLYQKKEKRRKLITPENAVLFIPIFSSIIIMITILSGFLVPQSLKVKQRLEQKKFLEEKISFIPIYENKLKELEHKKTKVLSQQGRLIGLVAGEKDLKTLLNQINSITINNNIKIIEVKPIIEKKLITSRKKDNKNATNDPLLQPSLYKYSFKLIVEGKYNDIIEMLREIEMLETFIIANNLQVQIVKNIQNSLKNTSKRNDIDILTKLIVELTSYGRKTI